jgi:hypothetical protein
VTIAIKFEAVNATTVGPRNICIGLESFLEEDQALQKRSPCAKEIEVLEILRRRGFTTERDHRSDLSAI